MLLTRWWLKQMQESHLPWQNMNNIIKVVATFITLLCIDKYDYSVKQLVYSEPCIHVQWPSVPGDLSRVLPITKHSFYIGLLRVNAYLSNVTKDHPKWFSMTNFTYYKVTTSSLSHVIISFEKYILVIYHGTHMWIQVSTKTFQN